MAHGWNTSPRCRGATEGILHIGGKEGLVSCLEGYHLLIGLLCEGRGFGRGSIPWRFAYSSRFLLICAIHVGSLVGSITVTITTGDPLPIATLGICASDHPPPCLLPWPLPLNSHVIPRTANIIRAIHRALSLRSRFFSAGGTAIDLWFRATYGGGRDVFRGGMAKCIVEKVVEIAWPQGAAFTGCDYEGGGSATRNRGGRMDGSGRGWILRNHAEVRRQSRHRSRAIGKEHSVGRPNPCPDSARR